MKKTSILKNSRIYTDKETFLKDLQKKKNDLGRNLEEYKQEMLTKKPVPAESPKENENLIVIPETKPEIKNFTSSKPLEKDTKDSYSMVQEQTKNKAEKITEEPDPESELRVKDIIFKKEYKNENTAVKSTIVVKGQLIKRPEEIITRTEKEMKETVTENIIDRSQDNFKEQRNTTSLKDENKNIEINRIQENKNKENIKHREEIKNNFISRYTGKTEKELQENAFTRLKKLTEKYNDLKKRYDVLEKNYKKSRELYNSKDTFFYSSASSKEEQLMNLKVSEREYQKAKDTRAVLLKLYPELAVIDTSKIKDMSYEEIYNYIKNGFKDSIAEFSFENASDIWDSVRIERLLRNDLMYGEEEKFNYVMGTVNLVIAGLDLVLAGKGIYTRLKSGSVVNRLAEVKGAAILAEIEPDHIIRLEYLMHLEVSGNIASADKVKEHLTIELKNDYNRAYMFFVQNRDLFVESRIRKNTRKKLYSFKFKQNELERILDMLDITEEGAKVRNFIISERFIKCEGYDDLLLRLMKKEDIGKILHAMEQADALMMSGDKKISFNSDTLK